MSVVNPSKCILWIEDNIDGIGDAHHLLSEIGWRVKFVTDFELAGKFMNEESTSMLICDLRLGSRDDTPFNTTALSKLLSAGNNSLPVVALTTAADIDADVIRAGADLVLRKPFRPENLKDIVESMLIRADLKAQKKPVFVAHEFSAEQFDDLRAALARSFADSSFELYYADKELRPGHILLGKIVERIKDTEFGIYDLSREGRPNVILELGIAIGLGKPYYIVTRKGCMLPSDLAGLDHIEYASFEDLTRQLVQKVIPRHARQST